MYYIVANQTHIRGKKAKNLDVVKGVFERAGKAYEVLLTDHAGHAQEYAEQITSREGEHSIVVMGGDGTLHEVLNGIKNFNDFSLGVIPSGTGNDFAAAAGIPKNVKEAAEIIAFRAPRPIDYIQLSSGLRSINAVGTGIDVDVLHRTYSGKNKKKSKYLHALIASLVKFEGINFTVCCDGREEKHFGLIAAIGNGKQIGGGIKLFPEGVIDDGMLDLMIVDYVSKKKMIGAFIKLMRGKVNDIKEATAIRCKKASIYTQEPFTIQAEGELYDNMPIEAEVVEGKLRFYLPD